MYSQYEEEPHILEAVGHASEGRFLDLGAWNPKVFSNTRALWELGWGGVMVEPSPEPFTALLNEYGECKRVALIHAAAGFHDGFMRLHATADGVSTSDEETYKKWRETVNYTGIFWSPVVTLRTIIDQFGPRFDFVNFDAEGLSVDLFSQFVGELGQRPQCVCVEYDDRLKDARAAAKCAGMRERYLNGTNAVFSR
jgi:FkbM family methyltransferase